MRMKTTALLAAILLSGAAFAQTAPTTPPANAPATTVRPGAPASPAAPPAAPSPSAATPVAATTAPLVVGDVVELKSGSPHMTVIEIGADVQVLWYTTEKGVQRERFPLAALEKTDLNEWDEYAPAASPDSRTMNLSPQSQGMSSDRRQEGRYESYHRGYYHDRYDRSDSRNDMRYRGRRYHHDDDDDYHYRR